MGRGGGLEEERREKGGGVHRGKSSFHIAVNGSRMENPTECRIRNES